MILLLAEICVNSNHYLHSIHHVVAWNIVRKFGKIVQQYLIIIYFSTRKKALKKCGNWKIYT